MLTKQEKSMKNSKLIWVGFSISLLLYLLTLFFEWDLFERFSSAIQELEDFEFDEVIIPILVFIPFVLTHSFNIKRKARMNEEKEKIYIAMLSSTYHILNNFLNQMQLFKVTAEETPGFDPEVLSHFDTIMNDALKQIEKLSEISNIDESSINDSVSLNGE